MVVSQLLSGYVSAPYSVMVTRTWRICQGLGLFGNMTIVSSNILFSHMSRHTM
jgi:hypothetical protein